MTPTILWTIFISLMAIAIMLAILKGGNRERDKRLSYPGEKGKADKVKSVWVNITVSDKDDNYLDGCVLKLVGNEAVKSDVRGEYIIRARVVKI